ncbi:MAG TPA: alpha/beta hydrolase [Verrucomicrobiae bacterium]|jgi:pimeloyl-ACP methyl ester carboxylesterase
MGISTIAATASPRSKTLACGQSHTAAFGTNKIHYVTLGEGSHTVVFIHGWACNLNFWREQAPALADKARLVFIDLPGHGRSDKPNTAYTMDFLARAVVAVLRDAGVEKAALVGHSMGAAVMCRAYSQAPEKVAALVSVDGLLCPLPGTAEEARMFIGQFCVPEYLQHARKFISDFFPHPGTEKLRDEVVAEMLVTPQYVMAGAAEGMAGPDQPDWSLQNVGVPVLVLNARSPWWNARFQHYVQTLSSRVDCRTLDGVGHFLMLEKPAEFNANLVEMLRKFDLLAP